MEQEQGPNKVMIGVIVVVLLAALGGGAFYLTQQGNDTTSSKTDVSQIDSSSKPGNAGTENNREYTDGTYTATGTYQSPGGQEEIELTVSLAAGKITDTSAATQAASGTSRQYQKEFINNYKNLIIGKNIEDVELDRVAGSSLTSNGFNDALDEIKQDAAA